MIQLSMASWTQCIRGHHLWTAAVVCSCASFEVQSTGVTQSLWTWFRWTYLLFESEIAACSWHHLFIDSDHLWYEKCDWKIGPSLWCRRIDHHFWLQVDLFELLLFHFVSSSNLFWSFQWSIWWRSSWGIDRRFCLIFCNRLDKVCWFYLQVSLLI